MKTSWPAWSPQQSLPKACLHPLQILRSLCAMHGTLGECACACFSGIRRHPAVEISRARDLDCVHCSCYRSLSLVGSSMFTDYIHILNARSHAHN